MAATGTTGSFEHGHLHTEGDLREEMPTSVSECAGRDWPGGEWGAGGCGCEEERRRVGRGRSETAHRNVALADAG